MSSADAQKRLREACLRKAGFTLIEMMAVMMIIALMSSLAVAMIPGTGRAGLKAIVMKSVALLRRERFGAMMTGQDRHVALDGKDRKLIGDSGDQVFIPADVVVDILVLKKSGRKVKQWQPSILMEPRQGLRSDFPETG